ncbi:hypothetical protein [Neisseria subflava]|uniref:hypothetical protein n=1 Tax=Neisseria subflava TaxID=28449 RepID=UPI001F215C27|nr:hypothetical protein [Neisseria subflava]
MFNCFLTFYLLLNFYRFSRNLNFVFNSIVSIAIPKINVLLESADTPSFKDLSWSPICFGRPFSFQSFKSIS